MRQSKPEHGYFEELCAVALIGQLTAHEQQELLLHLGECESCRRSADNFVYVLGQLPLTASADTHVETEDLQSEIRRQRFLRNASAEGIHFSKETLNLKRAASGIIPSNRRRIARFAFAAAACLLAAVGLLSLSARGRLLNHTHAHADISAPMRLSQPVYSAEKASSVSVSQEKLPDKSIPDKSTAIAARNAERELTFLRQQVALLAEDKIQLTTESKNLQNEILQLKSTVNQHAEALAKAKAKYEKLSNDDALAISTIVAQKAAIQQLQEKETLQAAEAERERQLNEAAKDVRQLMGARNLHIIDVHDLVAPDKQDKAFGRVFYAEGKSLVFYAFDLGKKNSSSKVIFQAWGHREGRDYDVKSLGVFNVDHDAQRRWVLRVDNPTLLSKIDTLYVTVEPAPGRDKPSGKKLLVAYLGGQPNHP
jgi:hypothetical protein